LTFRKYLVILAVVIFGSTGDAFLARGMKQVGPIDVYHLFHVFSALANPWVLTGIVSLLAFMASYMTALSFADLTYVMPATAISYINMAAIAHFWLGEHISLLRWLGIVFIVVGVGVVAGGPVRTGEEPQPATPAKIESKSAEPAVEERV
jgi:uncharacterized membrane protein